MDEFIRIDGEPEPVCANCDSYKPEGCINMQSEWFNYKPLASYGCRSFFPNHDRWPEADHD